MHHSKSIILSISSSLVLATCGVIHGQDSGTTADKPTLEDPQLESEKLNINDSPIHKNATHSDLTKNNQHYTRGLQALSDHMAAQAAARFQLALEVPELTNEQKTEVLIRLTEAHVRSNNPTEALKTLTNPSLKDIPACHYWRGQALAQKGLFREADAEFQKANTSVNPSILGLSLLSQASIKRSLGDIDSALTLLLKCSEIETPYLSNKAKLQLAEIYIQKNQNDKAEKLISTFPKQEITTTSDQLLFDFLQAKIFLLDGKHPQAQTLLEPIVEGNARVSVRIKHGALLGLSDCLAINDQPKAMELILGFIDDNPSSPLLADAFNRLNTWNRKTTMPGKLTHQRDPSETAESQLKAKLLLWSTIPNTTKLSASHKLIGNPASITSSTGEYILETNITDRQALSLYSLAIIKSQSSDTSLKHDALFDLHRLRILAPHHYLSSSSNISSASIMYSLEKEEQANDLLNITSATSFSPVISHKVDYLKALIESKKPTQESTRTLFESSKKSSIQLLSDYSSYNIAISYLQTDNLVGMQNVEFSLKNKELKENLSYTAILWMIDHHHDKTASAIKSHLETYPSSIHRDDLILKFCQHIFQHNKNPNEANGALGLINTEKLSPPQLSKYYSLKATTLTKIGKPEEAVTLLNNFIKDSNQDTTALRVQLGEIYFNDQKYNAARREFNAILQSHKASSENSSNTEENQREPNKLLEYAAFYSALSARREGTPQAREECIALYDRVIKMNGKLKTEAILQKASILVELNKTANSIEELKSAYIDEKDPTMKTNLGLVYALSLSSQPTKQNLELSEIIYKELLKFAPTATWSNRVHYYYGTMLEIKSSTKSEALDIYYRVINLENIEDGSLNTPSEWEWYYRCGFRAIEVLEEQKKWKAAYILLQKLEDSNGPRSREASEKGRKISMTHQIWDTE